MRAWMLGWTFALTALALVGFGVSSEAWAAGSEPARPQEAALGLSFEDIVREQVERLSMGDLESFVRGLDSEVREALPPVDPMKMIFSGEGVPWGVLGKRLVDRLVGEVATNASLLGQLIILGVFCAFLRIVASSAAGSETSDFALLLSLLVLLFLALQAFHAAVSVAGSTLDEMVHLMQAILPLLTTLLAASGAATTAAIFHPIIYVTVTGLAMVVRAALFPLVYVTAALAVIGSISRDFPVKRMTALLRTAAVTLLGLAFIAFFAVLKTRGAIAPAFDGVAMRTAKFLTGAFIPVVGGRIADALDVVVGGSALIKNAVGLFGMGAIAAVTAIPLMKVVSILIIFRLASALIEPITEPRLVQAMSGLADSLSLLLAGMFTAAVMFFVGVAYVVGVGNAYAAMR